MVARQLPAFPIVADSPGAMCDVMCDERFFSFRVFQP
jgi:hypothetical protein